MKRLSAVLDRYKDKKNALKCPTNAKVPKAYKHSNGGCCVDEKTVLYLCDRYIRAEYGRRGTQAVRAYKYTGSVIVLSVENALWAQEVWMQRNGIINYINALCGGTVVSKVVTEMR